MRSALRIPPLNMVDFQSHRDNRYSRYFTPSMVCSPSGSRLANASP